MIVTRSRYTLPESKGSVRCSQPAAVVRYLVLALVGITPGGACVHKVRASSSEGGLPALGFSIPPIPHIPELRNPELIHTGICLHWLAKLAKQSTKDCTGPPKRDVAT